MTYGVTIGTTNTLTQWGLILCADLNIGMPPLKSNLVDIPGRNGTVNMSYAVSGFPVYGNREITFTLFAAVDDATLNTIRAELAELCHGQEANLILPTDSTHYYHGLFNIGEISGYNSGRIPVSVVAEPYAYKNSPTTISKTIPSGGSVTIDIANEQMPANATINASGTITLTHSGTSYTIASGERALPFVIPSGGTTATATGTQGTTISIAFQEGRL